MKKTILIILLCVVFTGGNAVCESLDFLLIDPSPYSAGIANCGINNINNNPAAIFYKQSREVSFSHIEWFLDTRIEHFQFVYKINKLGIASSITYLYMGGIQGYDESGNMTPVFSVYNMSGVLALGYTIWKFSASVSFKFIQEKLADVTANGFAIDAGIIADNILPGFSCGLSALNIGPDIKYSVQKENLPFILKGLVHYKITIYPYDIFLNVNRGRYGNISGGVGIEGHYFKVLSLRIGYVIDQTANAQKGLKTGIGIDISKKYKFDYAIIPLSEFGLLHIAGLSVCF